MKIIFICLLISVSSCTVLKKRYSRGYTIDWNKNSSEISHSEVVGLTIHTQKSLSEFKYQDTALANSILNTVVLTSDKVEKIQEIESYEYKRVNENVGKVIKSDDGNIQIVTATITEENFDKNVDKRNISNVLAVFSLVFGLLSIFMFLLTIGLDLVLLYSTLMLMSYMVSGLTGILSLILMNLTRGRYNDDTFINVAVFTYLIFSFVPYFFLFSLIPFTPLILLAYFVFPAFLFYYLFLKYKSPFKIKL